MLCGDGLILWEWRWTLSPCSHLSEFGIYATKLTEDQKTHWNQSWESAVLFCLLSVSLFTGCFPLVVLSLKNRTFSKILWHAFDIQLAPRRKIWAYAICCNFNHMTNCINWSFMWLRPKMQATCNGCLACQSILWLISLGSGMSRTVHSHDKMMILWRWMLNIDTC